MSRFNTIRYRYDTICQDLIQYDTGMIHLHAAFSWHGRHINIKYEVPSVIIV